MHIMCHIHLLLDMGGSVALGQMIMHGVHHATAML